VTSGSFVISETRKEKTQTASGFALIVDACKSNRASLQEQSAELRGSPPRSWEEGDSEAEMHYMFAGRGKVLGHTANPLSRIVAIPGESDASSHRAMSSVVLRARHMGDILRWENARSHPHSVGRELAVTDVLEASAVGRA
jgi:hypothetical protein